MISDETLIYGKNPVIELLEQEPDRISKVFIRDTLKGNVKHTIVQLSRENNIPLSVVPGKKLYDMVGPVQDQGIVAECSAVTYHEYYEWLEETDLSTNPCVFVLDEIEDPHNFGAILRSAAAFNLAGVIIPKHKQAPVNPTVVKTSAGTAGRVPIIRVVNTNQTLEDLKEREFWIAGLDSNADKSIWEEDFNTPMAIVLGSEGKGLRSSTIKHCDYQLSIPMSDLAESLNVSVSAGIAGAAWYRARGGEDSR